MARNRILVVGLFGGLVGVLGCGDGGGGAGGTGGSAAGGRGGTAGAEAAGHSSAAVCWGRPEHRGASASTSTTARCNRRWPTARPFSSRPGAAPTTVRRPERITAVRSVPPSTLATTCPQRAADNLIR